MNPIEAASQHSDKLSSEPLAWMMIVMVVVSVTSLIWLAKYIILPFRDAVINGHAECDRKLEGVEAFQRETLVSVIEKNTHAFGEVKNEITKISTGN